MAAETRMALLAPVTTRLVNPMMRLIAGRLPGLAILTHRGRVTGRSHTAPVLALRRDDAYLIALWYGSHVDWVRNVLAAGGCELRQQGRQARLVEPEVFEDRELAPLPAPLRLAGRMAGLSRFMRCRIAS